MSKPPIERFDDGCVAVFAAAPGQGLPVEQMSEVLLAAGESSVVAPDLAQDVGAVLFAGPAQAIKARREARAAQPLPAEKQTGHPVVDLILDWFHSGERGQSSEALAVAGLMRHGDERVQAEWADHAAYRACAHPHDPDDLRRCLLLIRHVPVLRQEVDALAEESAHWAALARHWDELRAQISQEVCPSRWLEPPEGAQAPETYRRMKAVLGD